MNTTDYFVWDASPTAIDFGAIPLPFDLSIVGLVAAVIAFFWGFSKMVPDEAGYEEQAGPGLWKVLGLGAACLVGGQLLFLPFNLPTLSHIGPIQVRWYGILFASSFAVGYLLMRNMYRTAGRTVEELDRLLFYVLIATVVGARLGHVLFYDPAYYLRYPGQILAIWQGGLASHGAAAGILLAMYLYVKKTGNMNFLWLADRVVTVVALAGAFIRTGNFMNSEILGRTTDLPWAVVFSNAHSLTAAEQMLPRHPTMLYEAILCLIVFGLLWTMYRRYDRRPPEGSIFGIFLVLLFGGRFFLEFTKINQADFAGDWALNMGQWLSIPLVAFGIWLLWKKVDWRWDKSSS